MGVQGGTALLNHMVDALSRASTQSTPVSNVLAPIVSDVLAQDATPSVSIKGEPRDALQSL